MTARRVCCWCLAAAAAGLVLRASWAEDVAADTRQEQRKIAALVSVYSDNSHADAIVGRLVESDTLDSQGSRYRLDLASLLVDQLSGMGNGFRKDKSRRVMAGRPVRLSTTVDDALTLGTGKLAVDGVLLVFEGGNYPRSAIGSTLYPKRKYFDEVAGLIRRSGRVVPVFVDKHLADNWEDAKAIYDTAAALRIPLMAGSSLPVTWRYPPTDTRRDAPLKEVVVISYHLLDVYGFHALEALQALVERRPGGEHGVRSVQCLSGDAVWKAGEQGVYDPRLLSAALARQQWKGANPRLLLREQAKAPVAFVIEYVDGLRACVLTLDGAVGQWAAAWRYQDGSEDSTLFWVQEARPFMHFSYLLHGVEAMMLSQQAVWPVERTLLTSGVLAALLTSRSQDGRQMETPHLAIAYQTSWNWQQPPPLPAGGPPLRP